MLFGRNGDARLAAKLVGLKPDDIVIDVGCGPGVALRHAAHLGATVTGVDPAPVMLRVARALTRARRNIRYTAGNAEALPVGDGEAGVVWSIASVHHWTDARAAAFADRCRAQCFTDVRVDRNTTRRRSTVSVTATVA